MNGRAGRRRRGGRGRRDGAAHLLRGGRLLEGTIYTAGKDSFLASLIDIAGGRADHRRCGHHRDRRWRTCRCRSGADPAGGRGVRPVASPPRPSVAARPGWAAMTAVAERAGRRDAGGHRDHASRAADHRRPRGAGPGHPPRACSSRPMRATAPPRRPAAARDRPVADAAPTLVLGGGASCCSASLVVAVAIGISRHRARRDGRDPRHAAARPADRPSTWAPSAETIIFELRLPRVLTAMLVGGGLALRRDGLPGAPAQPDGRPVHHRHRRRRVARGGRRPHGAGAAAGLAIGAGSSWLGLGVVQAARLRRRPRHRAARLRRCAGANGRVPVVTLLLTGYAVSSVLAAGVALLMFLSGQRARRRSSAG